jgi:antitoxin component YwqK of YwqJK toxin-antitoxin module
MSKGSSLNGLQTNYYDNGQILVEMYYKDAMCVSGDC